MNEAHYPSLYSPDAFYKGIAQAITVWETLLFIHPSTTWQWPTSYPALIEHLGGKAALDWVIDGPASAVVVTLDCTVPDQGVAAALYATIQAALGTYHASGDGYDSFGVKIAVPDVVASSKRSWAEADRA